MGQISYYITQQQSLAMEALVKIPVAAGEGLTVRDAAYVNLLDGKMYAIDSDAVPVLAGSIRGFVETSVSAAATGSLVIGGILSGFSGLTPWQPVYADRMGAGTVTQVRPIPSLGRDPLA